MNLPQEPINSCEQEIHFTTLVLSLSTAALEQLGQDANKGQGQDSSDRQPNLCLARQTISMLEMLEKKTKGNLSPEENQLLSTILYDLRMRYVQAAQEPKTS